MNSQITQITNRPYRRMATRLAAIVASVALFGLISVSDSYAQVDSTWTGGGDGVSWNDAANWSNGVPNGIFNAFIDGNAGVNSAVEGASGITLDSLTVDAGDSLTLLNANNLRIATDAGRAMSGMINNAGSITLTNVGNNTDLFIQNGVTLQGGGSITLGGTFETSRIRDDFGTDGVLTNVDNTIQGKGGIGANTLTFNNQAGGLVDANDNTGSLTVDAQTGAKKTVNQGTFRASSGGNLSLVAGEIDNTGGTIEALAGSTATLSGNVNITGGTIQSVDDGSIEFSSSSSATLNDVSVSGNVNMTNDNDVFLNGTIDNQAAWSVENTANNTDVIIGETTTLQGGGSFTLGGTSSTTSRITDNFGTDGVLTNVDNTIQGKGSLGNNTLTFTNQVGGLVDANDSSGTLTIDPLVGAKQTVNEGTFRASSGGNLSLVAGDINNTGGMIEALAGSTVTLSGNVNITDGTLRSVGDGSIEMTSSSSATLNDLTVAGTVNMTNDNDVFLNGTIDNQAAWSVMNAGNNTDIIIGETTTLQGGGSFTLGGGFESNRITDNSGTNGVLTNVDNTIQGKGALGNNTLTFTNQIGGLVDANDGSGTLTIDPLVGAKQTVNEGTFRASSGGNLSLLAGEVNNTGGMIEALAGSTVTLSGNVNITDGTLRSVGDGSIEMTSSNSATLNDLTVAGSVNMTNDNDVFLNGTIDNQAAWSVTNGGNNTDVYIAEATTLQGGGSFTLGGGFDSSRITDNFGTDGILTNVDNTIQGKGVLGNNTLTFTNQAGGLVDANDNTGSLTIDPQTADKATINQGTFRASAGGDLILRAGEIDNTGGMIEALAGSTVTLNSNINITGGTLRSVGTGSIETGTGTAAVLNDLTVAGTVNMTNDDDVFLNGTIDNQAAWNVTNSGNNTEIFIAEETTLQGGGSFTLGGSFNTSRISDNFGTDGILTNVDNTIQGQGVLGQNDLTIHNQAGGLINANDMGGSGKLVIDAVGASNGLTNDGILRSSNGATLEITDSFTNAGTLDAESGLIDVNGALIATADSLLMGNGEIEASLVTNSGTIAPGASVGSLTIDSNLLMTGDSVFEIEIDSNGADLLTVDGDWTLDGILDVDLLGGFKPTNADSYVVGTSTGTLSGAFSNVASGGTLDAGGFGTFTVTYGGGSNDIVLSNFVSSAIPEPGAGVVLLGFLGLVSLRRRRSEI